MLETWREGYQPVVTVTVTATATAASRSRAEVRAEAIAARDAGYDALYREGADPQYAILSRGKAADTEHVLAGAASKTAQ